MSSFEDSAIRVVLFPASLGVEGTDKGGKIMKESPVGEERGSNVDQVVAWIGLDWADQKHQIAEYNVSTGEVTGYIVKSSAEELHKWVLELRVRYKAGKVAVVMEQARGSVVYALMGCEYIELYPINPQSLASYRKAFYSNGAKSDPMDATLMMEMVRKHPDRFRVWRPDDAHTRSLRLLVEGRRKNVNQVTRLTNQLTAQLKAYYPQALELAGELNSHQACDFLEQWATLGELKQASPTRLRNFYTRHGRPRREVIEERIKRIKEAVALTEDPAVVLAGSMMVRTITAQIRVLIEAVAKFDIEIAQLFQKHPDRPIFKSLPGAGPALAPRLLAAVGADRDRWESAAEIQRLSGIAPVTHQSGNSSFVTWRLACPKFMRQTFHEYAEHSVIWCDWAKAYYKNQRERGKDHNAAIRALAYKWIRIIWKCWKTNTPYNDDAYLKALALRGSPLVALAAQSRAAREEREKTKRKKVA
jgi:transposase